MTRLVACQTTTPSLPLGSEGKTKGNTGAAAAAAARNKEMIIESVKRTTEECVLTRL